MWGINDSCLFVEFGFDNVSNVKVIKLDVIDFCD